MLSSINNYIIDGNNYIPFHEFWMKIPKGNIFIFYTDDASYFLY